MPGGWDGMFLPSPLFTCDNKLSINQSIKQEVALSVTPLGFTPERAGAIDFGEWVSLEYYQLIYTRPFPEADLSGFIKPFSFPVWMLLLASVLFFSAITVFGQTMQSRSRNNTLSNKSSVGEVSPSAGSGNTGVLGLAQTILEWTISPLLMQSTSWLPRGTVLRMLGGGWLLTSLVLVTVYGSSLKAMLILPRVPLPFTTLEGLAASGITFLTVNGTFMDTIVKHAPADSTFGRIRKHTNITHNVVSTITQVIQGVGASSAFTSILLPVLGMAFNKYGYCKLYICESFFLTLSGPMFPKGSSLKPKVDEMYVVGRGRAMQL
ncbi:glutamate [NMDA] receptor subunit 1-like isoform X2 [Eriocheir sinensis]|uniref:glutamate [NMDA] receptor subunit 1-like isoform X2 n=1 Tax=Eriocheir sinensis TaxID=95602 RepID=UPI0021C6F9E1|nr:glutamate [NMDA] receptor subunit 1-like isoform X2 [Eriocheir sinensis]